jgi:predicted enzyme related to lactoylglutathione lyase
MMTHQINWIDFNPGAGPMGAIHGHMQNGPRMTAYLHAPDIDANLREVEAAGGQVVTPKMFVGDAVGNIAHFADPNGNLFGLWDRAGFGG